MNDEIKQNIKERKTWLRGFYMLLFLFCYNIAEILIFFVVLFQFVYSLLTGSRNEKLINLGYSLSTYVYQIMSYLTFNTEEHPYPFSDWPKKETKISTDVEAE